jgi:hypothetical protein
MNLLLLFPLTTEPLDFRDNERSGKIMIYCNACNSFIICFKYGKYQKLAKLLIYLRIDGRIYPCFCTEKETKNRIVKTKNIPVDFNITHGRIEVICVKPLFSLQLENSAIFMSFSMKIRTIYSIIKEILCG